ncbi:minor tail protein [Arthrobacter phage Lasagna]|uniref:Minor tail protein n=7 Tax=Korravirus drrobert TaxID=1982078 RepID=A0A222ZHY6_9CAUD|nr:minor tail protein [Arthrobacter phage Lucy]ASR83811.1 minor tail protein [Arthrobacter phage PitaDog]AZF98272.1 minor tail protein [Arthrobacter phage Bodacious]AZS07224.1 minor tail protein [Arthrobacter phage CristinaYang]AZS08514.1 minor tail protein [Arthrobacter phage Lasagna]AZS08676.1 minor tail protein [Arthrobacter phage Lennox]QHB36850.1 minor tail protein [Arthrobacter phage LilStuart]
MVVEDSFRVFVGEVKTGRVNATLPVSAFKWGMRLNAAGPVSATVRVASKEARKVDLQNLTLATKQFLGVSYGDTILECGPIWKRNFDPKTYELNLQAQGLWSIFDRRKNLPGAALRAPGDPLRVDPAKAKFTVANKHLGSIARELVRRSIQDNPWGGQLPISLPADLAGTATRTFYGYNLAWIGDELRELSATENGPDMRFRPRFKADDPSLVEWAFEHGTNLMGQAGPDWTWDASVEKSQLADYGVDQDGTELASMAWSPGSGQEEAMRLAVARNTKLLNAGYPWTEVENGSSQEESLAVLQALANRTAADHSQPWDAWSMIVKANANPKLGLYLPGDWAQAITPMDHPILPQGKAARVRMLSIDGDHTNNVSIAVAPIQGVS